MKSLRDEDLTPLLDIVRKDRGIDLAKYKDKYLRRRVSVRLRASGAETLAQYLKLLRQDPGEYTSFLDAMTVNTSSFFRNPETFETIASTIMPEIAAAARAGRHKPPYIWSVGCARGEEAYTLAILASRWPSLGEGERPPILATDLDQFALADARAGIYGPRALAELDPETMDRSFLRRGARRQVSEALRNLVAFASHDVLREPVPGRFLLVLCRNLIIYLEREPQERLMAKLASALHPGGCLVLGKSEILIGESRDSFIPVSASERIYRRVASAAQPATAPRRAE